MPVRWLIIIALLLVATIGGLATFAYLDHEFLGENNPFAPKELTEEEQSDAKLDKRPIIYIEIPPIVINFLSAKGLRYIQITITATTRDPDSKKILEDNRPLMQSVALSTMSGFTFKEILEQDKKQELLVLTREASIQRFLENNIEPELGEFLLTGFVVQ
jgi:flagellar basal body-associated protein FliL